MKSVRQIHRGNEPGGSRWSVKYQIDIPRTQNEMYYIDWSRSPISYSWYKWKKNFLKRMKKKLFQDCRISHKWHCYCASGTLVRTVTSAKRFKFPECVNDVFFSVCQSCNVPIYARRTLPDQPVQDHLIRMHVLASSTL